MRLRKWDNLPEYMKTPEVRPYWEILDKKRGQLLLKRCLDIVMSSILIVVLAIPMIVIAIMIKKDSKGTIFYRQERITTYGKHFLIHKFRTMVSNADQIGTEITVDGDTRITKVGSKLRDKRIDEIPQVFDVLVGNMSFVGTRPETVKYVAQYSNEMFATLLLPAGITSKASICYKDESKLLDSADNVDLVYINQVLPEKMKYNLQSIREYSFGKDVVTMMRTVSAVCRKDKQ